MANVAPALERGLLPAQLRTLRLAANASAKHGVSPFLVGGTVRDLLLNKSPADIDLSAGGGSSEFATALAEELDGAIIARSQFGTSKLKVGDAVIDMAMSRQESYAYPGALPTVAPGTIEEDLARRDFTINAMAVSLAADSWGRLLDPHGGQDDLAAGVVRVLHSRSFVDDATRILRAVRYAQRLGFRIEAETEALLRRDLANLDFIGGDRVRHELERIFSEKRAVTMLRHAQELGVLDAIYPSLGLSDAAFKALGRDPIAPESDRAPVLLSALAWQVPASQRPGLTARLNLSAKWARVVRDTGSIRDVSDVLADPALKPSRLYSLLRGSDVSAVRGCALSTDEPPAARQLVLYDRELRDMKPSLTGDDLIGLGVPEGPLVGTILDELLTSKLDGEPSTAEDERGYVVSRLQQRSV